jgi:rubrerythrin
MNKTNDNLSAAFAGESQANRKYLAYAQKAEAEGYLQIAKLFRAVAAAETVHALSHLRAMGGVHTTFENLQAAIGGENYEVNTMYPPFITDAEAEDNKRAATSLRGACDVEGIHELLYRAAVESLETEGKAADGPDYYVCPVCGYTHEGSAPERCPVCNTPGNRFDQSS